MVDVTDIAGMRVLSCAAEGAKLGSDRDATDLLGECFGTGAMMVVIPAARLSDELFALRTGLAGGFIQKFVNYERRLTIVGDVSHWIGASPAFRDFVSEANRGSQLWFVADRAELEAKLAA
jgi:hypothetical protein